jgi:hypothetical protein
LSIEDQSVTTFKDSTPSVDARANVAAVSEPVDNLISLKRFLGKPRVIATGNVSQLPIDMTQQAYDFSLLFDQQEVRTKLLNYTGIRFTMCARVMVNATPFDSGSVFLVYRPPGFVNRTLNLANALPIKNYALKPPHSFIDLSEESAVELRVPYYSPKRFLTTLECFAEGRLQQ